MSAKIAGTCATAGDGGATLRRLLPSTSSLGRASQGQHQRTSRARRERPCLANVWFTGERSVLSLPPMAPMPQALTHRTVSD